MKRFLLSFGMSVILVSMGVTMTFFELSDYEPVNALEEESFTNFSANASEHKPLRIDVDDDYQVIFEYDESLHDEVKIELQGALKYKFKSDNHVKINDYDWYRLPILQYFDQFMEGVKQKKLYFFHYHDYDGSKKVIIRCSKSNHKNISLRD